MKRIKALIITLENWISIPRLPKALLNSGFEVAAVCPENSYLCYTRYLDHFYALKTVKPDRVTFLTLKTALERWKPELIIPGDEKAVRYLINLVAALEAGNSAEFSLSEEIFPLLKNILVPSRFFEAIKRKGLMNSIAVAIGIPVPRQVDVSSTGDILKCMKDFNFPVILKNDIGCAGDGVFICKNEQELLENFQKAKNEIKVKDYGDINNISLQEFIAGKIGMFPFVSYKGELLGGFTLEKHRVHPLPTGPSSVIRLINEPEMEDYAKKIIQHCQFTGFGDVEYIIEEKTGIPYFMEFNPRPVPSTHLGPLLGADLCKAFFAKLSGQEYTDNSTRTYEPIALFPQEWKRDPMSPFLKSVYHDVPWDDGGLLRLYFKNS
jgi:hypothetical protein